MLTWDLEKVSQHTNVTYQHHIRVKYQVSKVTVGHTEQATSCIFPLSKQNKIGQNCQRSVVAMVATVDLFDIVWRQGSSSISQCRLPLRLRRFVASPLHLSVLLDLCVHKTLIDCRFRKVLVISFHFPSALYEVLKHVPSLRSFSPSFNFFFIYLQAIEVCLWMPSSFSLHCAWSIFL